MKFGLSLPNNQGVAHVRDLVDIAVEAEGLGFSSVWTSEHLFHSTYVEQRLGDKAYHEALTVLTAAAMATSKVKLGTSVLVLPWHHPVRLAKMMASMDDLSNGRVILGVGVAITEDEYANLGIAFNNRGKVTDDALAAMRALWEQEFPAHDGPYFQFDGLRCRPAPVQSPLPVYVGGGSDAAIRRALHFGQGWHPLSLSPEQLEAKIQKHDLSGLAICPRMVIQIMDQPSPERPIGSRKTLRGTPEELRGMVERLGDCGVQEIVLDANTGDLDRLRDTMRAIQQQLITRC